MTGAIFFMLLGGSTLLSMALGVWYFKTQMSRSETSPWFEGTLLISALPAAFHIAMILTILLRHK